MKQACYLRLGSDKLARAKFYDTVFEACHEYGRDARQLARYGQQLDATLHFVDVRGDEPAEYPDRILTLTRGGNVKQEKT